MGKQRKQVDPLLLCLMVCAVERESAELERQLLLPKAKVGALVLKMKIHVKILGKELLFTSPVARAAFFEKNNGKNAFIGIDDTPTSQMRRYFEGAVVPAVYYQHPHSGWEDFRDAREALLLEFIPRYTRDIRGNRVKSRRSSTELTKEGFTGLIERITAWMIENGHEVPDPEDFKAWRDSAPAAGEIYPPLARMKQIYDKMKFSNKPWLKTK